MLLYSVPFSTGLVGVGAARGLGLIEQYRLPWSWASESASDMPNCRSWASYSGMRSLSPVPEHSGTGLDPLISIPDWFRIWHFCSFRY